MSNKQTAVDWLYSQITFNGLDDPDGEVLEQAKQMEKEQAKRMYTAEEVYDLFAEWDMYQKGEPRVDEDEIPNGFMSFNDWFKEIIKQ